MWGASSSLQHWKHSVHTACIQVRSVGSERLAVGPATSLFSCRYESAEKSSEKLLLTSPPTRQWWFYWLHNFFPKVIAAPFTGNNSTPCWATTWYATCSFLLFMSVFDLWGSSGVCFVTFYDEWLMFWTILAKHNLYASPFAIANINFHYSFRLGHLKLLLTECQVKSRIVEYIYLTHILCSSAFSGRRIHRCYSAL